MSRDEFSCSDMYMSPCGLAGELRSSVLAISYVFGRRLYWSGAAKQKQKRQQLEAEVKKRQTNEKFGWGVKKNAKLNCTSSNVDRSTDEHSELEVNLDQPADTVAQECSTASDQVAVTEISLLQ